MSPRSGGRSAPFSGRHADVIRRLEGRLEARRPLAGVEVRWAAPRSPGYPGWSFLDSTGCRGGEVVATNPNDWNASIIKEFRGNAGRVGGFFAGKPVLLLHHTGAKSGTLRVNPLMYRKEGDNYVVFASQGRAPNKPHWFHNLKANPVCRVEVGTEALEVTARVAEPEEREKIYARQAEEVPQFREHAQQTSRTIAVDVLEPEP